MRSPASGRTGATPGTAEWQRTFCIITCPANGLIADIHHRMPVILPPEAYERWLACIEPDPRDLLVPYPAEPMHMWPVSPRMNAPANDDPDLLTPLRHGSQQDRALIALTDGDANQ